MIMPKGTAIPLAVPALLQAVTLFEEQIKLGLQETDPLTGGIDPSLLLLIDPLEFCTDLPNSCCQTCLRSYCCDT